MRIQISMISPILCVLMIIPTLSLAQFVSVEDQRFYIGDKPYYFVGTNFWYGAYLGAPDTLGDRQRLKQELDLLQKAGLTNLRILAVSEKSYLSKAMKPSIQIAPGELDEQLLIGLDYLLAEMAVRDMKAVLYLNNFWQWSGGMAQYIEWAEERTVPDPDITQDWDAYIAGAAGFYRSKSANELFRNVIKQIVSRKNTVNGRIYKEDPAIMAWELANEPRAGTNNLPPEARSPFIDWVDATAGYIKQLDANHLVTSGSEGTAGTSHDSELFLEAHRSSKIDYLTVHLWPKNWGWMDMRDAEQSYPIAVANARAYLEKHLQYAEQLNKPIVLEEFGIERDKGNYSASNSTHYRDRFFYEIFNFIETAAAKGKAMAGSNFWGWGGLGRARHDDFVWRASDEFTGDPPQEHQGLNSVFDTDSSTLEIIKNHHLRLQALMYEETIN